MTRHRFDPFSFAAGLLFLSVGLLLLSGGVGTVSLEWVGPSVAILLGFMILLAIRPERAPGVEARQADAARRPPPT